MRVMPRLSPLAAVLLAVCTGAHAQTLPRRENLETALHGRVEHDARRDRNVVVIAAGDDALLPIDGGPLADIEVIAGSPPLVWSSEGAALLVRRATQALGDRKSVFDTGARGRHWLRIDAPAFPTRVIVHSRFDGTHGGDDPWQVALSPRTSSVAREFAESTDHVVAFGAGGERSFEAQGQRAIRLDVWRAQLPRLLPADATWLHVEADGRVVFDGRLPTPALREQTAATDGCDQVLDLAGRVRVDLPADAREITVRGEPGTWVKVVAALLGSPASALPIVSEPGLERLVQRPGEPLDAAFNRALSRLPSSESDVFLGRFSYLRDVAIRPLASGSVETRRWRARFPDDTQRGQPATNRPADASRTIDATTFHWLPPGTAWNVDVPALPGPALLRVSVAHGAGADSNVALRLTQPGRRAEQLELDKRIVRELADATADADALLAVDPSGDPIVDASHARLLIEDARQPIQLWNAGTQGAWVAVERLVPAYRRLDDATLAGTVPAERLRVALLTAPNSKATDQFDDPAATRGITAARKLLLARARAFGDDTCVSGALPNTAGLAQTLQTSSAATSSDSVLARCAALRAAAIAPSDPHAIAQLKSWSAAERRPDLLTGMLAWSLEREGGMQTAATWQQLAESLDAEQEYAAAVLARRAAGLGAGVALPDRTPLAATRSAGDVRLTTARESEVAYALAGGKQATWSFPAAGGYRIELRRFSGGSAPQWVTLRSGGKTWRTALPAVDAERTELRDGATGAAPGPAVVVDFLVSQPGVALELEGDAKFIARVDAAQSLLSHDLRAVQASRMLVVQAIASDQCRSQPVEVRLPITEPGAPVAAQLIDAAIEPAAGSALLPVQPPMPSTDATALALDALWRLEHGDATGGAIAASRAQLLRDETRAGDGPVFNMLDDRISWEHVDPLSGGGRVLRRLADGHPVSPIATLRQKLAGASANEQFVLRPDQAWVLDGLMPHQRVGLVFEQRAALPGTSVLVRLSDGSPRLLSNGQRWTTTDTADAGGALHIQVGAALPGTFLQLALLDAQGTRLDATHSVAYEQTRAMIHLDRPSLLRIQEWAGARSTVRTQWVAASGNTTITPRVIPGAALRISRLAIADAKVQPPASPAPQAHAAAVSTSPAVAALPATSASLESATRDYSPSAEQASTWPAAWPESGGEDGTWGFITAHRQRIDSDDPGSRVERFDEVAWRSRYRVRDLPVWGRADATLRHPEAGGTVIGVQHTLDWRQNDGPWGATLHTSAWTQTVGAPLSRRAAALDMRAAGLWEKRRDDRWRDRWELGLTTHQLSLHDLSRSETASIDNDVYSRYRDSHRNQLDVAFSRTWRARYDTEWVVSGRAVARANDPADVDNAGGALAWHWARGGWMASTNLDARQYFTDGTRTRGFNRERVDAEISRLFVGNDTGWRVRFQVGRDLSGNGTFGGVSFEWFDHDGRGLRDFAPSELFLRGVTETDLLNPLVPPDPAP